MGGYYIEGDEGKYNTPFIACKELSDLRSLTPLVVEADYSGTTANPAKFYAANGGYLAGSKSGSNKYMSYQRMSGDTGIQVGANYYVIIGYSLQLDGGAYAYRVLFVASSDGNARDAIEYVIAGRWTSDNILYNSTGTSEYPSFVDYINEWDETPTGDDDNPEGLEAIGGEYADRLSLYSDAQEITDLGTPLGITPYYRDYYMAFTPYHLSQASFRMFSAAMWKNATQSGSIWQRIKELFGGNQNPMSAIISCIDLPLKIDDVNITGLLQMSVGGVDLELDNQSVTANHYLTRYHKKLLGKIDVKETWGTDKDYNSTSCSIYLPYIGYRELDARVIVGSKISLYVTIDYWTGDIVYNLHVEKSSFQNYVGAKFYSYSFSGNCASALPLSEANTNELRGSLLSGISSLATGFVSGGGALLSAGLGLAQSAIKNPITQTSGNLSGNSGLMCLQTAFLMFSRGVPVYPNGWRAEIGAPRSQTLEIASGMGYIKISEIKLQDIDGATDNEVATLQNLLKTEGVIL